MLDSTGHTKAHSEGLHTVMESDLESWQKQYHLTQKKIEDPNLLHKRTIKNYLK